MNSKKNIISAVINQFVLLAYGLVVPRLIISTFGSDTNGIVSSISQFLSFITLLEGGLGAVVLAELYKPIEENDINKINGILAACQKFFNRIALCFIAYTFIVATIFSIKLHTVHSWLYTSPLVFILSGVTLSQYLFSITNRLLLQADQKIYIVNNIISVSLVVNIVLAITSIVVFPNLHVLKIVSGIAFFIQPIFFRKFVRPEFKNYKSYNLDSIELKNRWSGFAQNLAYFVNMNTDIALITIFSNFAYVSIYSVYCLAVNAIRLVISGIANSYQSSLGKYNAQGDSKVIKAHFLSFCTGMWAVSTVLYCTCLLLINPFVKIYVTGVNDVDYYQPIFAAIIIIANYVYCIREPYRLLVLSAGKFKETDKGAIIEALLNIVVSVSLIYYLGLVGVAIGTFVAMVYRLIYFLVYLRKNIIYLTLADYIKPYLKLLFIMIVNIVAYSYLTFNISSFVWFAIYGLAIVVIESVFVGLVFVGPIKCVKLLKSLSIKINGHA